MKIKKIGIITGAPYASSLPGKILLISAADRHYGLNDDGTLLEQSYSIINPTAGYRKATESEITRHWSNIAKYWEPQAGDQVIVTQDYKNWFMKPGVIVKPDVFGEDYWEISNISFINTTPFNKEQMILSPNHGWDTEIEGKPKDITSDKSSKYHPDVVDELRKLDVGLVDLINTRVSSKVIQLSKLNEVIGGGFRWSDSPEGSSFWCDISNLLFEKKYEEANQLYEELKKPDDSKFSKFNKAITEEARNLDENLWKLIQSRVDRDIEDCTKLWAIVDNGFVWAKTEEPNGFWYDIYKHLKEADYSEANECYNNFIQESNKDKVKIPKEVIEEPIKENVIRFNGQEVRVGDIVSFTYFNTVETRVRVVQIEKPSYLGNMPFKVDGKTTNWPYKNSIRDFVNHSLEDSLENSSENCLEPYTVPMTTVKDIELENAKFRFPIGASVQIIYGIYKNCFGIIADHKKEEGDVLIGVEITSRDIFGSTLNGKIETTNGWYVRDTELIGASAYTGTIKSDTSSNAQISIAKTVGILLPTIPSEQISFTAGNGTNNLFIGDSSPAALSKNYDQEPIKIKSKPKKQFTIV